MIKGRKTERSSAKEREYTLDPRFRVFGMNVMVRMAAEPVPDRVVHCPKGDNILYGEVVSSGDGYDPDPNCFRPMPPLGSLIVFEEASESVEGHSIYVGGQEFRIIHADSILVGMPDQDS